MIETTEVNGRKAVVNYLTDQFEPTDKDKADLVKVTFLDTGERLFLKPKGK